MKVRDEMCKVYGNQHFCSQEVKSEVGDQPRSIRPKKTEDELLT